MKVAWLTPLQRACGISKYSLAVIPELARVADVDVWAPRTEDDYDCPAAPVHALRVDEATIEALGAYDVVFFNAGNNPAFHAEIHAISERLAGIVVIHDKRMHGFFFDLWAVLAGDPARYAAMMRYYYGEPGERFAARVLSGQANVDSDARFGLVEPAIFNARAIVVHSRDAASAVARYGELVPVRVLGLPFSMASMPGIDDLPTRRELLPNVPGKRVLLVSSGGVFEQKRLENVLRAMASRPALRERAHLAIVGGGRREYLQHLAALVGELGLDDAVTITGYVDDRTMYGWLAAADVAVNLRYPSMESGSLSLVEQMHFASPVVVSDTSHYADLPDAIALKIPVDDREVPALAEALESLVEDPALRAAMGTAAREFVARQHDPVAYAQSLVELATDLVAAEGGTL